VLAALLAFAACGGDDDGGSSGGAGTAAGSGELREVKVALVPLGGTMAIVLGEQKGIFEKHGVRLKHVTPAPTGAGQIPQLLNGQANVGLGALTSVITASSKNLPVQAVAAFSKDFERDGDTDVALVIPGDSDVKGYGDLEGKTVAVNSLQGSWEVSVREAVAKDGGDPKKVKLVAIPFADQAAAMRQKRVDGVMTLQPFVSSFLQQGYRSLGDPQAEAMGDADNVANVAFMAKSFLAKQPEAAKGFVAGLKEASEYANAHPDEIRKLTISETGVPADLVNKAPVPDFSAVIPPADIERWSELLVKYGILKAAVPVERVLWSGAPTE
jgi:NitT/TauT family transport system substrate-binding protein